MRPKSRVKVLTVFHSVFLTTHSSTPNVTISSNKKLHNSWNLYWHPKLNPKRTIKNSANSVKQRSCQSEQTHRQPLLINSELPMGITTAAAADGDSESAALILSPDPDKIPRDAFHLGYIIYFTLGAGYLLPWNAFITAVDYFTYLYPDASVDRVFAVVYMLVGLTSVLFVIAFSHKSNPVVRINVGYGLFLVALVAVPLVDVCYVKGRVGVYGAYYATVVVVGPMGWYRAVSWGMRGSCRRVICRLSSPELQRPVKSVLVSLLRVLTKSVYPQDAGGLRQSANLYFTVSILVMLLNIIFYNMAHKLPVIKYYNNLKSLAAIEEKEQKGELTGKQWRGTLWEIARSVKWYGCGISVIYVVTLSIFPGSLSDVHSYTLNDWYPIILIAGYNIFDLVGKSLTALCIVEDGKAAIGASFARVLFLPLFYVRFHGPEVFRTEVPVIILTCLLGVTNGYFTCVLMILAPKAVPLQHSATAGIMVVVYLTLGLAIGSVLSWFWVL